MFKSSRTDIQSIYLWSMLCVNISVGNRFDFASRRTHQTNQLVIGLIPGNQSVDRQHPKIIIACVRCQSLSKIMAYHTLILIITRTAAIITIKRSRSRNTLQKSTKHGMFTRNWPGGLTNNIARMSA